MRSLVLLAAAASAAHAAPARCAKMTCTAVHGFPGRWLAIQEVDYDGRPVHVRGTGFSGKAALVDDADRELWSNEWDASTPGHQKTWTLVDLDGDGRDELLEYDDYTGHFGSGSQLLIVHQIASDQQSPTEIGRTATVEERNSCRSTWKLVGRRIELVTTHSRVAKLGSPPPSCRSEGRHVLAWSTAGWQEM